MRKTKQQFLYADKFSVHTAHGNIAETAVASLFTLVPFYPNTASQQKHYTTIKNNKSISLPASNENTG